MFYGVEGPGRNNRCRISSMVRSLSFQIKIPNSRYIVLHLMLDIKSAMYLIMNTPNEVF